MKPLSSLTKTRDTMKADVLTAQAKLDALDATIATIKADGSRNPDWINAKITEARKAALPAIAAIVRDFDERLTDVVAQRRLWSNRLLVLSTQRFSPDDLIESTTRLRWAAELANVGPVLLAAIFDNARDESNLALVYQVILASGQPPNKPGDGSNVPLDLGDLVLPQQLAALQAIKDCENLTWQAHSAYSLASGAVLTGVSKLASARAKAATEPARQTAHNSAGREPVRTGPATGP